MNNEVPTPTALEAILPPQQTVQILQDAPELNNKTQSTFNNLLRIPFLQEIRAGSLSQTPTAKTTPIVEVISEGLISFSAAQITDVNIVRKLSSLAATIPRLAAVLPHSRLAEVVTSLVSRYVDFANKKSVESKKFHNKFTATLESTSNALDILDDDLDVLRADIQQLEDEVESEDDDSFNSFSFFRSKPAAKLLDFTRAYLRKYVVSDLSSEQSLLSTLAVLLSVSAEEMTSVVRGTNNTPDISEFLRLLKNFQTRLRDVRLLMAALQNSMRSVLRQSVSLMSTWYLILDNVTVLKNSEEPDSVFSEDEVEQIEGEWAALKENAEAYTRAVSDVSSNAAISVLERNVEIIRRSRSFQPRAEVSTRSLEGREEALSKLTTDEQTIEALDAISGSSGKIVATFNKLLRVPFLDSLKVSSSANSGTNKDGSGGEGGDIDLETLTLNFLQRYQKLQAETVPIARDLYSYARLQQRLIPLLDSSLSIDNFVRVNVGIISQHREKASEVHRLHNEFQQDWNVAILTVERAIGEQEVQIAQYKDTIAELIKQKKKMTMGAIFSFIGAALFTAAAFVTGGLLFVVVGATAIGLVVTGSILASEAAKIQTAIDGYRRALKISEETLAELKFVLPIMVEIRDQLKSITLIWDDIVLKLSDLETGTQAWEFLAFVLQGDEWDPFKEAALNSWTSVEKNLLAYIAIVSDVNPII